MLKTTSDNIPQQSLLKLGYKSSQLSDLKKAATSLRLPNEKIPAYHIG